LPDLVKVGAFAQLFRYMTKAWIPCATDLDAFDEEG
jgi:hypothetical protein